MYTPSSFNLILVSSLSWLHIPYTFKTCSWNIQIINIDALSQTFTWTCAWHVRLDMFDLRHPHRLLVHPVEQAQLTRLTHNSGMGGEVRSNGCNVLSATFQPRSVEPGDIGLGSIALSQIMAWRCALMMWCLAALLVRGNSSGLNSFLNSDLWFVCGWGLRGVVLLTNETLTILNSRFC